MTCTETQSRLNDYVDGELGEQENLAIESHCKSCPDCRDELVRTQQLLSVVHGLPVHINPTRDLWARDRSTNHSF